MSAQDVKKAKRRKFKKGVSKSDKLSDICAKTKNVDADSDSDEGSAIKSCIDSKDLEEIERLMDAASDDCDSPLPAAFSRGANPYLGGERCLLCRCERPDPAGAASIRAESEEKNNKKSDKNSFKVTKLPLWVCPSCRRSVEEVEKKTGLDTFLDQEFTVDSLSLRFLPDMNMDSGGSVSSNIANECTCDACTERRQIEAEHERETHDLQQCWTELRKAVWLYYRHDAACGETAAASGEINDGGFDCDALLPDEESVKELVHRLCDRDPHQLFLRLESQAREFVLEKKVTLLRQLTAGHKSVREAKEFIRKLLDEYDHLCRAGRKLSNLLQELEQEHLKRFKVTWDLHNKHLFQSIAFTDPLVQNSLPTIITQLRQVDESLADSTYPNLLWRYNKLENEMAVVSVVWRDCHQLIEAYNDEQAAIKVKQKMLKEDWEFFKQQRKLLEQRVMKNSKSKGNMVPVSPGSTTLLSDNDTVSQCTAGMEAQFTQTMRQLLQGTKPTAEECHCTRCNRKRCPCDECSITHMITCGIINPDPVEDPTGANSAVVCTGLGGEGAGEAPALPFLHHPSPLNYIIDVKPPSMSSTASSSSGAASPIMRDAERLALPFDDCLDGFENEDELPEDIHNKNTVDDDYEDADADVEDDDDDDDDDYDDDDDEDDDDDDEDDDDDDEDADIDDDLNDDDLDEAYADVLDNDIVGQALLTPEVLRAWTEDSTGLLKAGLLDGDTMNVASCDCHHCVAQTTLQQTIEENQQCQCHICLQQRGKMVSTSLPQHVPTILRPAELHLYPHIHGHTGLHTGLGASMAAAAIAATAAAHSHSVLQPHLYDLHVPVISTSLPASPTQQQQQSPHQQHVLHPLSLDSSLQHIHQQSISSSPGSSSGPHGAMSTSCVISSESPHENVSGNGISSTTKVPIKLDFDTPEGLQEHMYHAYGEWDNTYTAAAAAQILLADHKFGGNLNADLLPLPPPPIPANTQIIVTEPLSSFSGFTVPVSVPLDMMSLPVDMKSFVNSSQLQHTSVLSQSDSITLAHLSSNSTMSVSTTAVPVAMNQAPIQIETCQKPTLKRGKKTLLSKNYMMTSPALSEEEQAQLQIDAQLLANQAVSLSALQSASCGLVGISSAPVLNHAPDQILMPLHSSDSVTPPPPPAAQQIARLSSTLASHGNTTVQHSLPHLTQQLHQRLAEVAKQPLSSSALPQCKHNNAVGNHILPGTKMPLPQAYHAPPNNGVPLPVSTTGTHAAAANLLHHSVQGKLTPEILKNMAATSNAAHGAGSFNLNINLSTQQQAQLLQIQQQHQQQQQQQHTCTLAHQHQHYSSGATPALPSNINLNHLHHNNMMGISSSSLSTSVTVAQTFTTGLGPAAAATALPQHANICANAAAAAAASNINLGMATNINNMNNVGVGTTAGILDPISDCLDPSQDENYDSIDDSCSEQSSSTSTSNQKEGKYCDCCYCEFFGHSNPPSLPTSKNYAEWRDRLRLRLKRKNEAKTDDPHMALESPNICHRKPITPPIKPVLPLENKGLDELVRFINGADTAIDVNGDKVKVTADQKTSKAAKRARQKQRKAGGKKAESMKRLQLQSPEDVYELRNDTDKIHAKTKATDQRKSPEELERNSKKLSGIELIKALQEQATPLPQSPVPKRKKKKTKSSSVEQPGETTVGVAEDMHHPGLRNQCANGFYNEGSLKFSTTVVTTSVSSSSSSSSHTPLLVTGTSQQHTGDHCYHASSLVSTVPSSVPMSTATCSRALIANNKPTSKERTTIPRDDTSKHLYNIHSKSQNSTVAGKQATSAIANNTIHGMNHCMSATNISMSKAQQDMNRNNNGNTQSSSTGDNQQKIVPNNNNMSKNNKKLKDGSAPAPTDKGQDKFRLTFTDNNNRIIVSEKHTTTKSSKSTVITTADSTQCINTTTVVAEKNRANQQNHVINGKSPVIAQKIYALDQQQRCLQQESRDSSRKSSTRSTPGKKLGTPVSQSPVTNANGERHTMTSSAQRDVKPGKDVAQIAAATTTAVGGKSTQNPTLTQNSTHVNHQQQITNPKSGSGSTGQNRKMVNGLNKDPQAKNPQHQSSINTTNSNLSQQGKTHQQARNHSDTLPQQQTSSHTQRPGKVQPAVPLMSGRAQQNPNSKAIASGGSTAGKMSSRSASAPTTPVKDVSNTSSRSAAGGAVSEKGASASSSSLASSTQDQGKAVSGKNRKKGKKNKNSDDPSMIDEIFMPKTDSDLENGDMDDFERELEEFKRFCFDCKPQKREKLQVNVNIKDIFNKKKSGVGCS